MLYIYYLKNYKNFRYNKTIYSFNCSKRYLKINKFYCDNLMFKKLTKKYKLIERDRNTEKKFFNLYKL